MFYQWYHWFANIVQGFTNGTNGIPTSFKVLPMVPMAYQHRSMFYQWYQWHTNLVQGSTNGTNGIPTSFKVLPMVPVVYQHRSRFYQWINGIQHRSRLYQWYQWYNNIVQGSTNGTNSIPTSFKVLPMVLMV